ncbi:MAG: CHRD domain-containing protein, partial [Blastocatellia bacterium]
IHTGDNPNGAQRGQLQPQTTQNATATLGAVLSPANEVPPVTGAEGSATGQGNVVLHLTEDQTGTVTAATADFSFNVSGLPSGDQIILAHVHMGAKGTNGGVLISSGISPGSPISLTGGAATFSITGITVDPADAMAIAATPANFYFNVHTTTSTGGVIRGQLEVPPILTSASITGKKLILTGTGFAKKNKILINGQIETTTFSSSTQLIANKGGKMIATGQTVTLQVKQKDGLISPTLMFTRN